MVVAGLALYVPALVQTCAACVLGPYVCGSGTIFTGIIF